MGAEALWHHGSVWRWAVALCQLGAAARGAVALARWRGGARAPWRCGTLALWEQRGWDHGGHSAVPWGGGPRRCGALVLRRGRWRWRWR